MIRIGALVLNVSDTGRAAASWSRALGYRQSANPDFRLPAGAGDPEGNRFRLVNTGS